MEKTTPNSLPMLSPREELDIGVMVSSELMFLIQEGKLTSSDVRSALREVVQEVGIGHTDDCLVELTVHRIRQEFPGMR